MEGWHLQNDFVVYSYFHLLCAGAGIPPVLQLGFVPVEQTSHQVAERLATRSFCSWSNHPVRWDPPSLQYGRQSKGPPPYWQDAILAGSQLGTCKSKRGLFLQAMATADLRGDRGQQGTSSWKPSVSSPWWWFQWWLWPLWDWRRLPEVWGKRRSWINSDSWKGSSAWKCWGLPGRQREVIITAFLWQLLSFFRTLYQFSFGST